MNKIICVIIAFTNGFKLQHIIKLIQHIVNNMKFENDLNSEKTKFDTLKSFPSLF